MNILIKICTLILFFVKQENTFFSKTAIYFLADEDKHLVFSFFVFVFNFYHFY